MAPSVCSHLCELYGDAVLTIADLALAVAESLADELEPDGFRLRLVRQFLMDASRGDVQAMVEAAPPSTGSVNLDAFANRGVFISRDSLVNI